MMDSIETGKVLYEHYFNCVKYWMKNGQDERNARLSALYDIKDIRYNPFIPFPKDEDSLDLDAIRSFKQARLMDIFGKQWKEHEDLNCERDMALEHKRQTGQEKYFYDDDGNEYWYTENDTRRHYTRNEG